MSVDARTSAMVDVVHAAVAWRANLAVVDPSALDEGLAAAVEAWRGAPPEPVPEWVPIPWTAVREGDRIRLGAAETTVLSILTEGPWQTAEPRGNPWRPTPWRHCETWVELEDWRNDPDPNRRRRPIQDPNNPIDVLMDAERKAIHLLSGAFGTITTIEGD